MKVTPQISADLEEYPELRTVINAAMRPVVDLMGVHAIVSLRRMHKVGVFDHPYSKDVVTPLDIPAMPPSVKAAQYAAGKAMLDYLETIGITGVSLEMTEDEARQMATLWTGPLKLKEPDQEPDQGPGQAGKDGDGLDPIPADLPSPKAGPEPSPEPSPEPGPELEPEPKTEPEAEPGPPAPRQKT